MRIGLIPLCLLFVGASEFDRLAEVLVANCNTPSALCHGSTNMELCKKLAPAGCGYLSKTIATKVATAEVCARTMLNEVAIPTEIYNVKLSSEANGFYVPTVKEDSKACRLWATANHDCSTLRPVYVEDADTSPSSNSEIRDCRTPTDDIAVFQLFLGEAASRFIGFETDDDCPWTICGNSYAQCLQETRDVAMTGRCNIDLIYSSFMAAKAKGEISYVSASRDFIQPSMTRALPEQSNCEETAFIDRHMYEDVDEAVFIRPSSCQPIKVVDAGGYLTTVVGINDFTEQSQNSSSAVFHNWDSSGESVPAESAQGTRRENEFVWLGSGTDPKNIASKRKEANRNMCQVTRKLAGRLCDESELTTTAGIRKCQKLLGTSCLITAAAGKSFDFKLDSKCSTNKVVSELNYIKVVDELELTSPPPDSKYCLGYITDKLDDCANKDNWRAVYIADIRTGRGRSDAPDCSTEHLGVSLDVRFYGGAVNLRGISASRVDCSDTCRNQSRQKCLGVSGLLQCPLDRLQVFLHVAPEKISGGYVVPVPASLTGFELKWAIVWGTRDYTCLAEHCMEVVTYSENREINLDKPIVTRRGAIDKAFSEFALPSKIIRDRPIYVGISRQNAATKKVCTDRVVTEVILTLEASIPYKSFVSSASVGLRVSIGLKVLITAGLTFSASLFSLT